MRKGESMNNMDYIEKVNKRFGRKCTERCLNCLYFWLQYNSLQFHNSTQNFFEQYALTDLKIEKRDGIYYGSYQSLEENLIKYCRQIYALPPSSQNEKELVRGTTDFINGCFDNNVKERLKLAIDLAAQATKSDNPQMSIAFDGIGLIYADNLIEVVNKVISMIDTAQKANE